MREESEGMNCDAELFSRMDLKRKREEEEIHCIYPKHFDRFTFVRPNRMEFYINVEIDNFRKEETDKLRKYFTDQLRKDGSGNWRKEVDDNNDDPLRKGDGNKVGSNNENVQYCQNFTLRNTLTECNDPLRLNASTTCLLLSLHKMSFSHRVSQSYSSIQNASPQPPIDVMIMSRRDFNENICAGNGLKERGERGEADIASMEPIKPDESLESLGRKQSRKSSAPVNELKASKASKASKAKAPLPIRELSAERADGVTFVVIVGNSVVYVCPSDSNSMTTTTTAKATTTTTAMIRSATKITNRTLDGDSARRNLRKLPNNDDSRCFESSLNLETTNARIGAQNITARRITDLRTKVRKVDTNSSNLVQPLQRDEIQSSNDLDQPLIRDNTPLTQNLYNSSCELCGSIRNSFHTSFPTSCPTSCPSSCPTSCPTSPSLTEIAVKGNLVNFSPDKERLESSPTKCAVKLLSTDQNSIRDSKRQMPSVKALSSNEPRSRDFTPQMSRCTADPPLPPPPPPPTQERKEKWKDEKEKMVDREFEQKSRKPFQNRHFNHFSWIFLLSVSQTM